jgi:hypothetical protein
MVDSVLCQREVKQPLRGGTAAESYFHRQSCEWECGRESARAFVV